MHRTDHSRFRKAHDFVPDFSHAERRTRIVIGVTAAMMVVEIVVGLMSHSMALLADGWHMSTHVLAFLITAAAYYLSRTQAGNVRFSFGTGKIGVLGGFTSAVVLSIVAFLMAGESVHRLFVPLEIHFNEAIGIACVGLLVNLSCAALLADRHHESGSSHREDLNLRAAYLHVLADAFTSVLAITALTGGKFFGWAWLDPVVGIVGSGVVFSWAYTLLRDIERCCAATTNWFTLPSRRSTAAKIIPRLQEARALEWPIRSGRSSRLTFSRLWADGLARRCNSRTNRFAR